MRTIRSMRVMLPDGRIEELSLQSNPDLFRLIVGGYGLFGIILDATLEVEDNYIYEAGRRRIGYDEFPRLFESEFKDNENYGLMYGHLSTAPSSLLKDMVVYAYRKADAAPGPLPPLEEVSSVWLRRLTINLSRRASSLKN